MRASTRWIGVAAAAGLLALAACSPGGGQGASGGGPRTVTVDGSSTVFPISEAVAEAFNEEQRGRVRVSVGESGTGGGFRRFCRGETDVQGASRPILEEEIAMCRDSGVRYVEAPVAFDGITVVVHPSNPIPSLTLEELRRIWEPGAEGQITNWRQVNPAFPDLPMQLYGAGTASGTFDYFTEAVNGAAQSSRMDFTPTENDNVTVTGVANNTGAIGYFGIAYYLQNQDTVRALPIDNGDGPVAPTIETVGNGTYQPLSRAMFVYVSAEALRRPEVRQFALYYLSHTEEAAVEVGYVPLPSASYEEYARRITDVQTGTAFGGHNAVGMTIEELKARPLVDPSAPAN